MGHGKMFDFFKTSKVQILKTKNLTFRYNISIKQIALKEVLLTRRH